MSGPPDHGGNKPPGQGMVGFLFEALILIACDAVAGSNRNGANNLAIQPSWRVISLLWSPYNRADHYIFALWFLSFFFFLLSFFSSTNLSGRRLDVYHTSTHGVALVRI